MSLKFAAIVALLTPLTLLAKSTDPEMAKPNILFILTDDQGYGDVSRLGNPILQTPNIDKLHDQSVRFTDFCVSSSCSPTRASLLSGMYNLRVGVTNTTMPRCKMNTNITILPEYLKSAGYATACIGKWHLGDGACVPGKRGFDYVAGNKAPYQKGKYREDILFDEAMGFIERSAGQPWFCYLATWSPHAPLVVPDKYVEPYRGKVDEDTAHFFGMIANLDENLGRLMSWLEEKGFARNTIVIFMNDNGGTYGIDTFNAGMRGCKATAWPGGARAMSFWRWPQQWSPRDVGALTAHVDVLPTLAAVAGVELPKRAQGAMGLDGHSLLALLEGRDDPWFADRMLFQHNGRWPGGTAARHKESMAGVRWREYLLVRSRPCSEPTCGDEELSGCARLRAVERGLKVSTYTKNAPFTWGVTPGEGWALYDVHKDPACETDLASSQPALTQKLHQAYDQWWDAIYPEMIAAGGDAQSPVDTETKGKRSKKTEE